MENCSTHYELTGDPTFLEVPLKCLDTRRRSAVEYSFIVDAFQSLGLTVSLNNVLVGYTSYKLPFAATDSRFQNSREFLSFLLIMVVLFRFIKAPRGTVISVKSDSMSALMWLEANKMSSVYGQVAFMSYTYASLVTGYVIAVSTHIAGNSIEMAPIDSLSRDSIPTEFDPSLCIDTSFDEALD